MINMHPQGRVASEAECPNAGIDVSKEHLNVHLFDLGWRVDNDASGRDALIVKLKQSEVDLVVVEATGGYERGLVTALHRAQVNVARVNPRQAREFAKSMAELVVHLPWVKEAPPMALRVMQSRWGSCSPNGRLTLNPLLVRAPREAVDYVIVHELCHLRHHHHGPAFYRLLGRYVPAWKPPLSERELQVIADSFRSSPNNDEMHFATDIQLEPDGPPLRRVAKACQFRSEIARLYIEGHTCDAIRRALEKAGVHVSESTVRRELGRSRSEDTNPKIPKTHGPSESAKAPPSRLLISGGERTGKEIAADFFKGRITNPLFRDKAKT